MMNKPLLKWISLINCIFFVFHYQSESRPHPVDWGVPVQIDTAKLSDPHIAVSLSGQIAVLSSTDRGTRILHISNDQGRTFQRTHEFIPPVRYFNIFGLNGFAYDQNNVLWVYWAWDECSDGDCTFTRRRWLYLSRSTDSGKTFDHILKLNGYFLTAGSTIEHDPYFAIGKDNTVYMLRDTAWYVEDKQFTGMNLIYTILPQGDLAKRQDYSLPALPDSLVIHSISSFCLTEKMRPLISVSIYKRKSSDHYLATTRFTESDQFSHYSIYPATKYISMAKGTIYRISLISEPPDYLVHMYVSKSDDQGQKFGDSVETNVYPYFIQSSNLSGAYALYISFGKPRIMTVYRFTDPMLPPTDTLVVGYYYSGALAVNDYGDMYIVANDTLYHSYFFKKNIPTEVHNNVKFLPVRPTLGITPNPFNNSTTITYRLPHAGQCKIKIHDLLGRLVEEFQRPYESEGDHAMSWSADRCASGIYFVTILFDFDSISIKAVITK